MIGAFTLIVLYLRTLCCTMYGSVLFLPYEDDSVVGIESLDIYDNKSKLTWYVVVKFFWICNSSVGRAKKLQHGCKLLY